MGFSSASEKWELKKVVIIEIKDAVGTTNDITQSEKSRGFPDKSAFRIMHWL